MRRPRQKTLAFLSPRLAVRLPLERASRRIVIRHLTPGRVTVRRGGALSHGKREVILNVADKATCLLLGHWVARISASACCRLHAA